MKKIKYALLLSFVGAVVGFKVNAQDLNFAGSQGGAVTIEAKEGIEWDRVKKTIAAIGDATVLQGNKKIVSHKIEAFYYEKENPEIYKFVATSDVVLTTDDIVIKGDAAIYNLEQDIVEIKGNPASLTQANDTILAYDKIEYFKKENKAIATGKASIISDGKKLTASTIEAYFIDNKEKNMLELNQVKTFGGVEINTASEKITANQGSYDAKKAIATLKGNVIISQNDNHLRGEEAEVNLITGISRLKSDSKNRVKGSFVKEK